MTVHVIGWNARSAVALVDGVRVRIRRKRHATWWVCDDHGRARRPHCPHLQALAETPSSPNTKDTP